MAYLHTLGLVSTTNSSLEPGLASNIHWRSCSSSTQRAENPANGWLHRLIAAWKIEHAQTVYYLILHMVLQMSTEIQMSVICCRHYSSFLSEVIIIEAQRKNCPVICKTLPLVIMYSTWVIDHLNLMTGSESNFKRDGISFHIDIKTLNLYKFGVLIIWYISVAAWPADTSITWNTSTQESYTLTENLKQPSFLTQQ